MAGPVQSWSNINASPPRFNLGGGTYQFMGVATAWGTAVLDIVGPDGTTLLAVTGANLGGNGYVIFQIGSGALCQLTLGSVTGFYGSIAPVPLTPPS